MIAARVLTTAALAAGTIWSVSAVSGAAWAQAEDSPALLFSYEALAFSQLGIDGEKVSYEDRVSLTERSLETEVPVILDLLGIDEADVETQVTPGGYLLETNASLQSSFDADPATADLFASAVGYVFRQWSILVTDFTPDGAGDTGYAVVTFAGGPPSGPEAQAFFEHAASVDEGLGGGYTAFGSDLYFLNVTDGDGNPYSGLDDDSFVELLTQATDSYAEADVSVTTSGRVDARFVWNDWESAPEGEQYAETLGLDLAAQLYELRLAHEAALIDAAEQNGWR